MLRTLIASIVNPRFRRYHVAKKAFEEFCIGLSLTPDGPTDDQREMARNDPHMNRVEAELKYVATECERIYDFYNAAACHYELGMLYNLQGRWPDAGRSLIDALEAVNNRYGGPPDPSRPWAMHLDEKLFQMDRDSKRLVSGCRFQLGLSNMVTNDFEHAKEQFQKSLDIDREIGDIEGEKLCEIGLQKCEKADTK